MIELIKQRESIQEGIDFINNELESIRKGSELYHYLQTNKLMLELNKSILTTEIKSHLKWQLN